MEVMFPLNGLRPDFRTIADFRKEHSKYIRNTFVEFTRFCTFFGLYDPEGREEAKGKQSRDPHTLEEKIRALKDRKANYEAWKKELAESRATQKLLTDPQARMMHTTKDGYHCCYNVQTAVSAQSKLVVDYQVTNHINDQGILHAFSQQIKETVQTPVLRVIADKGYDCQKEVLQCLLDGTLADVGFKELLFPKTPN